MAQVRAININLSSSSTMVNSTRSLRFRRPRVQHAIRVAVLLRRAIALRRLRWRANALSAATPPTFQPRNVVQGVSVGNVQLQVHLADHEMNHISGDFLMAIAEWVNNSCTE